MHKKSYFATATVFLAVAVGYLITSGVFSQESAKEVFALLSNAFFIPGVLFFGIGGLSWCAYEGTFDMISYSFTRYGIHNLIPGMQKDKPEEFYEYKQEKEEKRGKKGWLKDALIVGLIGIVVSVVFLVVYVVL